MRHQQGTTCPSRTPSLTPQVMAELWGEMEKPSDASGVRSSQDSAVPQNEKRDGESWVTNKCHKRKRERENQREGGGRGSGEGRSPPAPFIQFLSQPGMHNVL